MFDFDNYLFIGSTMYVLFFLIFVDTLNFYNSLSPLSTSSLTIVFRLCIFIQAILQVKFHSYFILYPVFQIDLFIKTTDLFISFKSL